MEWLKALYEFLGTGERSQSSQTSGDLWSLLREHAAWLNTEKQIIWRRFQASITAVSIYFTGSILTHGAGLGPLASLILSFLGLSLCVIWLFQTAYGWRLLDRRLQII